MKEKVKNILFYVVIGVILSLVAFATSGCATTDIATNGRVESCLMPGLVLERINHYECDGRSCIISEDDFVKIQRNTIRQQAWIQEVKNRCVQTYKGTNPRTLETF